MSNFEAFLHKLHQARTYHIAHAENTLATRAIQTGFARHIVDTDGAQKNHHQAHAMQLVWNCAYPSLHVAAHDIQERPIQLRWTVSSTQAIAKRLAPKQSAMLLAEHQLHGVGRRKRTWHSPPCCNIYATYTHITHHTRIHSGLSLAVAVIVSDVVRLFGGERVQVKWPNDILLDNRKVAGILIDSVLGARAVFHIGIGINCHTSPCAPHEIDQPWIALDEQRQKPVNRMLFALSLHETLTTQLPLFFAFGLAPFQSRWHEYDTLQDRPVALEQEQTTVIGTYRGINQDGQVRLEKENGIIDTYSSAVRCRALDCPHSL